MSKPFWLEVAPISVALILVVLFRVFIEGSLASSGQGQFVWFDTLIVFLLASYYSIFAYLMDRPESSLYETPPELKAKIKRGRSVAIVALLFMFGMVFKRYF